MLSLENEGVKYIFEIYVDLIRYERREKNRERERKIKKYSGSPSICSLGLSSVGPLVVENITIHLPQNVKFRK